MGLTTRKAGILLWGVQGLLAALFLFAGGMKLVMSAETLRAMGPLPPLFLKFIGVCEVLGAIGLILPELLHIRPGLTPLAAAGLLIIMIGATVVTLMTGPIGPAVVPFIVGLLLALVINGRWLAPRREASGPAVLQPGR